MWKISAAGLLALAPAAAATDAADWLFPDLPFRVPVTVKAGLYDRDTALVSWPVDFTAWLGRGRALDDRSIRVVAEDGPSGAGEVACRFLPSETASAGELAWAIPGTLRALEARRFHVYFDAAGASPRPVPPRPPVPGLNERPQNLVRNPGFEEADPTDGTSPAEWSLATFGGGTGTLAVVQAPVRSGAHALEISATREGRVGCRQENIPLKPNTLYRLSAWVRDSAGPDPDEEKRIDISATLRRADGANLAGTYFGTSGGMADSNAWRQLVKQGPYRYQNSFPTPPNTAWGNIDIVFIGDANLGFSPTGQVYVDDVELIEIRPEDQCLPLIIEPGAVEKETGDRP